VSTQDPPSDQPPGAQPETAPARRMRPCPICNKMAVKAFHPFCSKRCADVDLNRWLSGAYAIPVADDEEDDEGPQ